MAKTPAKRGDTAPAETPDEISEMTMLALKSPDPAGAVEKLMTMRHLEQDRQAEREFNDALNAFHDECPPLRKNREAKITTRGGGSYGYTYADLATIDATIRPVARKHGFRWRWTAEEIHGKPHAVCILRHVGGHEEPSAFPFLEESSSPISAAQKSGAAFTYAKRQSLLAAFGLTAYDEDTDGATVHMEIGRITEEQAHTLHALIEEVGADVPGFLKWAKIDRLEDLSPSRLPQAIHLLEKKRGKK